MEGAQSIVDQAIAGFSQMPFETKELYKKYILKFDIPEDNSETSNGKSDTLKKQIILESRLKFDLTNDKSGISTSSEFVKVTKRKKEGYTENLTETYEERIGGYISKNTENVIEIGVPDGKEVKLNFLLLGDNANTPMQILINVGKRSKLSLFEWFGSASASDSLLAPLHVVNAEKDSKVEIDILHNENSNTAVGALNRITAGESSIVRFNAIYNGGSATKSTTFAEAAGKGSDLLVNEVAFGNGEQKFDINTLILNSNEMTKAVLKTGVVGKGKSFSILKGYAKVTKDSRGSYSNVEEKGLGIDPDARLLLLPDMSIDCKDVAFASHSAATAPVDKEALFYLMSRGIDESKAKRIFVASFLSKYLAPIENDIVKEIAISILLDKLDNDKHTSVPKISLQNMWIVPSSKR